MDSRYGVKAFCPGRRFAAAPGASRVGGWQAQEDSGEHEKPVAERALSARISSFFMFFFYFVFYFHSQETESRVESFQSFIDFLNTYIFDK